MFLLVFPAHLLLPYTTFAAEPQSNVVKKIGDEFHLKAAEYGQKLKGYAIGIFKLFLLVGIVVFGIQAALGRAEIADVIKEFITMMVFAAFCFIAIQYYQEWTEFILDKTTNISKNVGGVGLELNPIDVGFQVLTIVLDKIGQLSWGFSAIVDGLGYIVIAGIILCCLALITARMLVILCESYIAMNIAILMLGFGAASFAREYAINVMRYVVSLAFKLLTMQLVIGIGMSFIRDLSLLNEVDFTNLFVLRLVRRICG